MTSPPERAPTRRHPRDLYGVDATQGGSMSSTRPTQSDDHDAAPRPALVWAALAIVYLVWGSTYLAIRICVHTLPPFVSAGIRFGLAGLLLGVLLAVRRGIRTLRITRRQFAAS